MENEKLPIDHAALNAAYIENEPDELITDITDSHNGINNVDGCPYLRTVILLAPLEHVLTNFYQRIYGIFHGLICRH